MAVGIRFVRPVLHKNLVMTMCQIFSQLGLPKQVSNVVVFVHCNLGYYVLVLHVLQQSFRGFFFAKCLSVRLLNNIVDNICLYKDTRIFELVYNNLQ